MEQRNYPLSLRLRSVRMVFEVVDRTGRREEAIASVAGRLSLDTGTLRHWVRQAEMDAHTVCQYAREEQLAELTQQIYQIKMENAILRAASDFFARELDPRIRT